MFFQETADIFPKYDDKWNYRRKILNVVFLKFRKFNITLNLTEETSTKKSSAEKFLPWRTLVKKIFSEMILDWCISFVQTPLLALPHFHNLILLLLIVLSCSLFFNSPLSICYTQRKSHSLTKTVVILASHSFKNSVTMIANSIYTEAITFLLLTSIKKISISQSGRVCWIYEKIMLSEEGDLFWRGVKRWVSLWHSKLVKKPMGFGWHNEFV